MSSRVHMFDDSTLIRLTLSGKAESFNMLLDRHGNAVRARIRAIVRNPSDADDVFQEVWFKTWRNLSSFRSESTFRTYIISIATRECFMLLRRGYWRECIITDNDLVNAPSLNEAADEAMLRAEQQSAVRRAVVKLPAKYQQVLILRDIQELSIRETAERLRSTEGAVKTRLLRARHMLVGALKESSNPLLAEAV